MNFGSMPRSLAMAEIGCSSSGRLPPGFGAPETAAEEAAPLGGTSLGHRRRRMERMYRDLAQMQTSLDDVGRRADRSGLRQLRGFVDAYMGLHLEPMLRPERSDVSVASPVVSSSEAR